MLALSSIHQHGVCTVAVGGDVGACQGTRPEEGAARPSVAILVSTSLPPSLRTSGHHPCWPGGRAGLGRALGLGCEVTGLLRIQDAGEAPGAVMTDVADQSRRRARPSLHRPSPSPSSLASWLLRGLPCHLSTEQQAAPSQKAPWIMTRPCGNCQSRAPSTVTPFSFLDTRGGWRIASRPPWAPVTRAVLGLLQHICPSVCLHTALLLVALSPGYSRGGRVCAPGPWRQRLWGWQGRRYL